MTIEVCGGIVLKHNSIEKHTSVLTLYWPTHHVCIRLVIYTDHILIDLLISSLLGALVIIFVVLSSNA